MEETDEALSEVPDPAVIEMLGPTIGVARAKVSAKNQAARADQLVDSLTVVVEYLEGLGFKPQLSAEYAHRADAHLRGGALDAAAADLSGAAVIQVVLARLILDIGSAVVHRARYDLDVPWPTTPIAHRTGHWIALASNLLDDRRNDLCKQSGARSLIRPRSRSWLD